MRTGEFWEEESLVCSPDPATEDVTALLNKVLSHVASIDNNGLIQVIRVNKKPELMSQSVYN